MIEQDYQIIDPVVFPDHVLREDIDECLFSRALVKKWVSVYRIAGDKVKDHSHSHSFRCLKKYHPAMIVSQPSKPIVVEDNKTYLTSGGYVVQILSDYFASKETSPGVNTAQQNISQVCATRGWDKSFGWGYCKNGTVSLSDEWGKKLRITEELSFSLPSLPSGYKWLGDFPQFRVPTKGEYFIRWHSKTGFGDVVKCDGNYQVTYGTENRRLIVVATQPKESVVVQPQPLSTEGMVEVTHLKDYLVQKDDMYVKHGKAHSAGQLSDLYPVRWYTSCEKLYATKKNYDDYIAKNSPKPEHSVTVTEGPVIGAGYRKIDPKIDTPQEGDQFWSQLNNQWLDRPIHYGNFSHIDTYRRLESSDYVILDPKIYGDCVPTTGHQYKKREHTKWESMTGDAYKPIKHWAEYGYVFRCKKANVPIVNTLPINNRADAAQISGVACATPPNKFQVQENEMNSPKSEETVKFETAKKLAVATAKLGGKMIWRTADYFVFAPIKKAASPFMWMVRYAVLGTMVGGGVYASFNPDDAKEMLWKCIPKISITVDAPEVLG